MIRRVLGRATSPCQSELLACLTRTGMTGRYFQIIIWLQTLGGCCVPWQSFLYRDGCYPVMRECFKCNDAGKQKRSFSASDCACIFWLLVIAYGSKWKRENPSWKCGKPVQVHGWSEQDKKPCLSTSTPFWTELVDSLAFSIYFDLVSVFKNRLCLTVLSNI